MTTNVANVATEVIASFQIHIPNWCWLKWHHVRLHKPLLTTKSPAQCFVAELHYVLVRINAQARYGLSLGAPHVPASKGAPVGQWKYIHLFKFTYENIL